MKKVLVISYYYPPRPGVGTNRIRGLTKYLHRFGWEPVVLTTELGEGEWAPYAKVIETEFCSRIGIIKKFFGFKDGIGLQQQIGINKKRKNGIVNRFFSYLKDFIAFPDEFCTWIKKAEKIGMQLIDNEKISVIISSSSPVSTHLIASRLSRKKGVPWVADLRDLWTQNHYHDHTLIRRIFERNLEKRTLRYASALVTVSEPYAEQLRLLHGNKDVYCITNGFDPDEVSDYCPAEKTVSEITPEDIVIEDTVTEDIVTADTAVGDTIEGRLLISHTGSLYDLKKNPGPLFKVIRKLIDNGYMDRSKIQVNFYGPFCHKLEELIKVYKLERIAVQHGIINRNLSMEVQRKSSVLLVMEWDNPGEEGVYTGKIFEYLAARRPILAIGVRGGVLRDLLNTTRAGVYATSEIQIEEFIKRWYEECINGTQPVFIGDKDKINEYSHVNMAGKYSELLNRVSSSID
ncbi:MAG TPA: glycosyltransferase [Clostridiales bacterium]|nr:glycosyltransferase [Clostridiales bacterium]